MLKLKKQTFLILFILSIFNLAWISLSDFDFGNLKNKSYYKTLFSESELLKLAEADDYYVKGKAQMLDAEKYFRKADGFKKVAQNYGGKTLKKAKRYEKKGVKTSLKAYDNFFKASDIKFHVYSNKLKNMNKDNSKRSLKAEEISINARSVYIEGTEMKSQAKKLTGKAKSDALEVAFGKHKEAIHMQETAFGIYMDDPDVIYDEAKDEVVNLNDNNKEDENIDNNTDNVSDNQNYSNDKKEDIYNSDTDPNVYKSKEDFIIEKSDMSEEDVSALNDAKDKKQYADQIMKEVDSDYEKIEKIRNEAENTDDEYEKNMKAKMAEGMEDVLTDKMIKAAGLYFNANKTKYDIYKKYLPVARTSDKINQAKKYEDNAEQLQASALMKYHKTQFYSGHKTNKYIQLMDAVQTELSAIQEQENAFSIYFNKEDETVEVPDANKGKSNDNGGNSHLTYNLAGSYMYSKSNPKPVPLKNKPGIIFKVQVGLFKKMLPLSRYGKYSPISYETFKNNPYKRFYLGEYRSYRAAEYVLNKIKRKGLSDPFVVAFENGIKKSKTYGISKIIRDEDFEKQEAREMSLLTGKPWYGDDDTDNTDVNYNENENINTGNNNSSEIKNVSAYNGLIYCVQIGNFSSPKQKSDFTGVSNLLTENNKGTYKYLAGPYSTYEDAKKASIKLKSSGYEGAFVTAYNYGEKISLQQAKTIAASGNNNYSVSEKNNKDEIFFSVQIAAYSHKLNDAEMQEFGELTKRYKINVIQIDGGLFLYTIGKYSTYKDAAEVKKEIKALHYDGFVIAFKNGVKISASKAIELLKN